jgi:hypothetical protein
MTLSPCLPLEELAALAESPASDPRRRHVSTCPRCRALTEAYGLYLEPGDAADAAHVARADSSLSAFLAREIGVPAAPSPERTPDAAAARREGRSWFERLRAPVLRPALAFAVLAIALGGVALWPRPAARGPSSSLRGERAAVASFTIREARLDAGGMVVSWESSPEADDYEVSVYSAELAELARLHANGDTVLTASPSELSFRIVPGQTLLVRVFARRGGDPIGASAPRPLLAP